MITQNHSVDIILPVSGNYRLTLKCINSILKKTNYPFKLIIVDNGISDQNLLFFLNNLKQSNDNIKLITGDAAGGISANINKCLDSATSENIALLSNYAIVSENWLAKLLAGFKHNKSAGIIAPRCNNNLLPHINVDFPGNTEIDSYLKTINSYIENIPQGNFMEVPFVLGYCLLIKKELIDSCGGFDSIYGNSLYFSDFDLCFRAARKGYRIIVSNKTVIYRDNSDLENIRSPQVRLPVNFTIFRRKWKNHEYLKYLDPDLFPSEQEQNLQTDGQGFYFNEKLKPEPKKYLLINPSIVDTKYSWRFSYIVPPTGILRVASYLINEGHKINFYDFEPFNSIHPGVKTDLKAKEELFFYGKAMADFNAYIKNLKDIDEVFISVSMTFHYPHLAMLIEKIRQVYGEIKITVGGIYATLCPEEIRKLGVEVHAGPYYSADQLRPLIELSCEKTSAVLRVVKGCPRTCSYCVVPGLEGRKLTHYQKEDIIRHFQEFYAMGYTNYLFWDSNLLFGRENLYILIDFLLEYGYQESITIDFSYGLEFALIDDQFIEKIGKFSLYNALYVPLESSEYDLYKERFHRPNSHLGVITRTVQKLQKANHKHMSFYVMLGLPNQMLDQILKTLVFGWRLGLTPVTMLYTPIPGTEEFPKFFEFYKDKQTWELNPYLYPCESEELTRDVLLFIDSFTLFRLDYSPEEGFFIYRYINEDKPNSWQNCNKLIKIPVSDQNHVMKRLKELLEEENVKNEGVDPHTLRFLHALNL